MQTQENSAAAQATEVTTPKEGYVLTMEGTEIPEKDAYFCEYFEEYTENETYRVYTGRVHGSEWSEQAIEKYNAIFHNPTLYEYEKEGESIYITRGELWRFELCWQEDTEEIEPIEYSYLHEDGNYYSYEEEREEEYTREYHSDTNTYYHHFSPEEDAQFFIGYEIEKEDREVKESICIDEFEEIAPKWRKEKDSSLDENEGFELISPCFELCPASIQHYIEKSKTLLRHVNAEKSDRCGGHINISERGKRGRELFIDIQGYTPLLHALYYKRIDKGYSKGKCNEQLIDGDKYQSVRIHSNRVELRIISAVPNLKTLIWRTRLIQYILHNQTSDPREVFINFHDTELKKLICEVYDTPQKFATLNERLIRYTRTFEDIDVIREILNEDETAQIAKDKNVDIRKALKETEDAQRDQIRNSAHRPTAFLTDEENEGEA